jgi:hypothetical protein
MNYNLILESLLYISPNFRNTLEKIDHVIAEDLLEIEGSDISSDISFIDIDENGLVTFLHMKNAIKKFKDFDPNDSIAGLLSIDSEYDPSLNNDIYNIDISNNNGPGIYNNVARNSIRIGRLINIVFPGKYKDKEIEEFVNLVKSFSSKEEYTFEILEGEKIREGYSVKNYALISGSLGGSCMNNKLDFLDIYVLNPEVCSLLILKKNDKIYGRALLWKIDKILEDGSESDSLKFEYFLDRIYTTDEFLIKNFINHALSNKWAYKSYQSHSSREYISYNEESDIYVKIQVKVKPINYKKFPYMDTFSRLDIRKGILHNDSNFNQVGHILTSLDGNYSGRNYPPLSIGSRIISRFRDFLGR